MMFFLVDGQLTAEPVVGGEREVDDELGGKGEVCTMRGKKIRPGDVVGYNGQELTVAYES